MKNSNIPLIIEREFKERVRKKSFIITTVLMPILMLGMVFLPALIMKYTNGERREVVVVDQSGIIAPRLESNETILFSQSNKSAEEAQRDSLSQFGLLIIGRDVMTNPDAVSLYTSSTSSLMVEEAISSQINKIIETERLRQYNIENLDQIIKDTKSDIRLQTFRTDIDESKPSSSAVASVLGMALGFILYMFLIIYGAMVMQSVIEEKSSRVLEVLVSSVKPFELMMGKILGVASVALVQILIWVVLLIVGIGLVLPMIIPADIVALAKSGALASSSSDIDPKMLSALAMAFDVNYIITIAAYLILFLIGGYLLYSAMFAAVGSAVDNVQDAQQLQTPIMLPIIASIFVMMTLVNDPNSTIAVVFSMIPFTSPIVMMARIPNGIPAWEIWLSLALLYASFVAMVWLSAKIYRIGIFMYGKKVTFKEIYRWIKY